LYSETSGMSVRHKKVDRVPAYVLSIGSLTGCRMLVFFCVHSRIVVFSRVEVLGCVHLARVFVHSRGLYEICITSSPVPKKGHWLKIITHFCGFSFQG